LNKSFIIIKVAKSIVFSYRTFTFSLLVKLRTYWKRSNNVLVILLYWRKSKFFWTKRCVSTS